MGTQKRWCDPVTDLSIAYCCPITPGKSFLTSWMLFCPAKRYFGKQISPLSHFSCTSNECDLQATVLPNIVARDKECMAFTQGRYALEVSPRITTEFGQQI
ncbi:hypothetical protein Pelo_17970 [Pelomyxa schiedti]|nr:hypothetical protein Pelo_17970 [Pelomyxa schiedti]